MIATASQQPRFQGTCRLGETLRFVGLIGLFLLPIVIVMDWQVLTSGLVDAIRISLIGYGTHAVASLLVMAVGQALIYMRHIACALPDRSRSAVGPDNSDTASGSR